MNWMRVAVMVAFGLCVLGALGHAWLAMRGDYPRVVERDRTYDVGSAIVRAILAAALALILWGA